MKYLFILILSFSSTPVAFGQQSVAEKEKYAAIEAWYVKKADSIVDPVIRALHLDPKLERKWFFPCNYKDYQQIKKSNRILTTYSLYPFQAKEMHYDVPVCMDTTGRLLTTISTYIPDYKTLSPLQSQNELYNKRYTVDIKGKTVLFRFCDLDEFKYDTARKVFYYRYYFGETSTFLFWDHDKNFWIIVNASTGEVIDKGRYEGTQASHWGNF